MKYTARIMRTPTCGRCMATKLQLGKVMNINENVMDPNTGENMEFANKMKERGLTQSPFVFIEDENGEVVDSWNNFQIKKIQKWVNKLS